MSLLRSDVPAENKSEALRQSLPLIASRVVGVCGFFAVAISPLFPWFTVPHLREGGGSAAVLFAHEAAASGVFRGLCLAVVVLSLVSYRWAREWRRPSGWAFLILSVALLFFPYSITVWSPRIAGEASWLYSQHEDLSGGSGDIFNAQEYKDSFWRQRIYLVNRAIDSEIHLLPDWGPANFGWGRLVEMVEWFGLSGYFTLFLGKGWVLAVLGAPAVLCALARGSSGFGGGEALRFLRRGVVLFGLACGFALIPPSVANWLTMGSRQAAQQNDDAGALRSLERAARWMPSIREDGNFVLQKGLLEDALGRDTPTARYYQARLHEEDGLTLQARSAYVAGLSEPKASPALIRENVKALLRLGADALNSGDEMVAIDLFETVMRCDPCNLRANYGLQLACLHQGDREALRRLHRRMTDTYQYMNAPTKTAVLAHGSENLAFSEYLRGDLAAALDAWKGARRH